VLHCLVAATFSVYMISMLVRAVLFWSGHPISLRGFVLAVVALMATVTPADPNPNRSWNNCERCAGGLPEPRGAAGADDGWQSRLHREIQR